MKKHVIWSNRDINIEDWRDDYKEFLEVNNMDVPQEIDDDDIYVWAEETNNEYLGDERVNLDVQLPTNILVIADLGRWDGRHVGYREIGNNISDCLYSNTDYTTWYLDEFDDFCCEAIHHDGTNYYRYRTYREGVTDEQIEDLKEKLYYNKATEEDVNAVTRSLGTEISNVYGW